MTVWNKLPLRIKLTVLYVGLLALILAILGTSIYLDDQKFLLDGLKTRIRAQAKPIIAHWLYSEDIAPPLLGENDTNTHIPLRQLAKFLARDLTSRYTGAIILDTDGQIIARGKQLKEEPSCPTPRKTALLRAIHGQNDVSYSTFVHGRHLLVLFIPLRTSPNSSRIIGVAEIATPLTTIDNILREKRTLIITGIMLALILSTILGLIISSSVLKDLTRMVETCEGIASGDLSRRIGPCSRRDEISRLSESFDHMADTIQKTFEGQKRFIAKAAHEIRTPLTAILGSLEVLMRGVQDDPEKANKLIPAIYREAKRLSNMCEQLLDLSRLDSVKNIQKKPINLKEFVEDLLPRLQLVAKDCHIEIKQNTGTEILIDPELFTQVFLNLADNSQKYTSGACHICISWELNTDSVTLSVKDNGQGIDPIELKHIFEPFFQGHYASSAKGTGLGLSLVKEIIEAHQGTIKVRSIPGKGTTFIISLPIYRHAKPFKSQ